MEVSVRDVAQFLKVLADESRLQILWLLLNHEELCVCDLGEALGVSQSKVSRHLATLRHTGLVTDRKKGAWSFYSILPAGNDLESALLDTLRVELADHPDAVRTLQSLHHWLEIQKRDVACGP
jgi:ArsR family transcriptional regulator, arsenate/arsenite/antimonite-responsive transcriptional repressor